MLSQLHVSSRMIISIFCGIVGMSRPCCESRGEDDSTRLKNEFVQSALPAWRALQQQLLRSRGEISYRSDCINLDDPNDKTPPQLAECEFQNSGFENRLVTIQRMQHSKPKHVYVGARNPKYQFRLKRPIEGGEYLIDDLRVPTAKERAGPFDDSDRHFHNYVAPLLYAPFSVDGLDLSRVVSDPLFKIDSVRKVSWEGTTSEVVELRFSYPQPGENVIQHHKSRVVLDPDNSWSLVEYQFDLRASNGETFVCAAKVKYSDGVNGKERFRYPIEVRETIGDAAPPRNGYMTLNVYTLKRIEFVNIPSREFTLSAFGLPEVVGQDKAQAWSRTVWMLIVINVALVLCGLWWYLSKRTRQAAH